MPSGKLRASDPVRLPSCPDGSRAAGRDRRRVPEIPPRRRHRVRVDPDRRGPRSLGDRPGGRSHDRRVRRRRDRGDRRRVLLRSHRAGRRAGAHGGHHRGRRASHPPAPRAPRPHHGPAARRHRRPGRAARRARRHRSRRSTDGSATASRPSARGGSSRPRTPASRRLRTRRVACGSSTATPRRRSSRTSSIVHVPHASGKSRAGPSTGTASTRDDAARPHPAATARRSSPWCTTTRPGRPTRSPAMR